MNRSPSFWRTRVALVETDTGFTFGVTSPHHDSPAQDFTLTLTHRQWLELLASKQLALPHDVKVRINNWSGREVSITFEREGAFHFCLWFADRQHWLTLFRDGQAEAETKDSAQYIGGAWERDVPLDMTRWLGGEA